MNWLAWLDRNAGRILGIALVLGALAALLLLTGCGRRQVQDFSDAKAGAIAYQQEPDPERRAQIAAGVMGYLLAALEQYPLLPLPTRTPAEIRADPAGYAADGEQAQADPQPYRAEDHPTPQPPKPGPLDWLRAYGETVFRVGLWLGTAAVVAWSVIVVARWLGWAPTWRIARWALGMLLPVARLAALWGAASTATGAALVWLADWWWAVLLVAVLAAAGVAWAHWRDIRAWWLRRMAVRP